jgi:spore germination protein KC
MRRKKYIVFILIICLTLSTAIGCWNNMDITKRSIAVAVGIDITDDNKIEVTVQVVKTQALKGEQEGGSGSKDNPVWVLSSTGESTFDAIRNFLKIINRKIFFTDTQVIVIGERLARHGIMEVMDFFERDQETNLQAFILIAINSTAKDIINAKTGLDKIPAVHIADTLENNTALSKTRSIKLFDALKEMGSNGRDVVIGTIESSNNKGRALVENMKIEGAAVFEKDKMVGWLNGNQTRGLLFIESKVKSTIIYFADQSKGNKKVSIEVLRSKGKKSAKFNGENLEFNVDIKVEGNIGGQQVLEDLTKEDTIKMLESQTEKVIEKEIQDVIATAKKDYIIDIFGFGEIVHRKYPGEWNKFKKTWGKTFAEVPVNVNVTAKIRGSGYITKPTKPG